MKPKSSLPVTKRETAHAAVLRSTALADRNSSAPSPATRMSVPGVERLLDNLAGRVAIINPMGLGAKIKEWCADAKEAIHTEDWLKSKAEVAIAAARGDSEALALHAATVQVVTENMVTGNSNWLPFFEMRSLADDEYPEILPEVIGQKITVDSIGQDGGNTTVQSQPDSPSPIFVPLNQRATKWIEYPLKDLYKGSVKEVALAQFDVARDRLWRLDELLASYLLVGGANTRLIATFDTTNADIGLRDYWATPRVNVANLPTGNFITLSGNSTTSLFRKEVFDAILKYANQWGSGIMEGGGLAPVEIQIASLHMTDFLSQVTMNSYGTNKLEQQVFDGGIVTNYAGRNWIITGNNTIDPNQGVAYVRMDQPVGVVFDKPGMAEVIVDENPNLRIQNKGRTCETWVEAFAMPLHWRKRMFGVRYKTAT